jgi:hypothetical protein
MTDSLHFSGRFDSNLSFNVRLVSVLINHDIMIASCPGELFVQLGLDWKKKIEMASANPFSWIFLSGGDWPGYVADVRSAALGGYGADQDPKIIAVGAGESITTKQLENYYRLTGLMRENIGPSGFKAGDQWIIKPFRDGK